MMPIPIEVEVVYIGGVKEKFYIPLQMMRAEKPIEKDTTLLSDWAWARPNYSFVFVKKGTIVSVKLDPENKIADLNLDNNTYTLNSVE